MDVAQSACAEGATKRCTKCGEVKPLEAYAINKRGAYGRQSMCRSCQKAKDAERYAKAAQGVELRDGCKSPERCASKSDRLCRLCVRSTEEYKSKFSSAMREVMSRPEQKHRMSAHMSALHENPKFAQERDDKIRRAAVSELRNLIRNDPDSERRRKNSIQLYWVKRRENEEFEAFMERMERENWGMDEEEIA